MIIDTYGRENIIYIEFQTKPQGEIVVKIQEKCLPCIVNQAIKIANMVGLKEKDNLLRCVFDYLSRVDYQNSSTPELVGEIFSLLKKEVGNDDPYKETADDIGVPEMKLVCMRSGRQK